MIDLDCLVNAYNNIVCYLSNDINIITNINFTT